MFLSPSLYSLPLPSPSKKKDATDLFFLKIKLVILGLIYGWLFLLLLLLFLLLHWHLFSSRPLPPYTNLIQPFHPLTWLAAFCTLPLSCAAFLLTWSARPAAAAEEEEEEEEGRKLFSWEALRGWSGLVLKVWASQFSQGEAVAAATSGNPDMQKEGTVVVLLLLETKFKGFNPLSDSV